MDCMCICFGFIFSLLPLNFLLGNCFHNVEKIRLDVENTTSYEDIIRSGFLEILSINKDLLFDLVLQLLEDRATQVSLTVRISSS